MLSADQKHQTGDAQQQRERLAGLAVQLALPSRAGFEIQFSRAETLERRRAHALLKWHVNVVQDRTVLPVHARPGLLDRDTRLEAGEEIDPVDSSVL